MLGLVETLYNRLGRNSRTNHCVEVVELETDTPEGVTHEYYDAVATGPQNT